MHACCWCSGASVNRSPNCGSAAATIVRLTGTSAGSLAVAPSASRRRRAQVLALGQRPGADGQCESFLLIEPLSDTCSLEAWLACQTRRLTTLAGQARRWAVLRQAGALLQRLHDASCYLKLGPAGCGLAVRQADGEITVVLDGIETVTPRRRRQPGASRPRRDAPCSRCCMRPVAAGRTSAASDPAIGRRNRMGERPA